MHLRSISLRHFRNLGIQELTFPPEGVAIIGANAQGKSNLLEAIYYLEIFRSFRGAPDEQLAAFGEDVFRVEGEVEGESEGALTIAAALKASTREKRVQIDGAPCPRLSDALGRLCAVVFSPSDVEIVSSGPQERRRFLDVLLSLNERGYLSALQEYRRSLSRRNATLRSGGSRAEVAAWDPPLLRSGARLMRFRASWIRAASGQFSEHYAAISGGAGAELIYDPSVPLTPAGERAAAEPPPLESFEERFRERLTARADHERRMGHTSLGPHRDDFGIELDSVDGKPPLDLRRYGSGGERRTAALALRLIEAGAIMASRGTLPIVLLDDAFAELDEGRSERVLGLLEQEGAGQVLLTAPKESDVRVRRSALPRWRIEAGVVRAA